MADTSKQQRSFEASAVGSDEYLTSLIRRLDVLEKKIVGQHGLREDQPSLKPTVEVLENKLSTGFSKVADVHTLWSKISALEKVLDPAYISNLKLSDSAKTELLIRYASQLKDLSKPIEELQKLKDYLNLTEFQGLQEHEKKLASVATTHAQQELQIEEISRQVHELLSAYSKIMLQLSAQLVEWGERDAKV